MQGGRGADPRCVLVVGATGQVGGMIVGGLQAAGHRGRAFVRDASSQRRMEALGVETVVGDLKDPTSLPAALAGVDTVVTTANAAAREPPDTVEAVDRDGTLALIDAAERAGVDHFIYTSLCGVSAGSPLAFVQAKAACEARLKESSMATTILRPEMFLEDWVGMLVAGPVAQGEPVRLPGNRHVRHTFISARDVARVAVASVAHEAARDAIFELGGPETVTWEEVAHRFAKVAGCPLEVLDHPPEEPLPGLPPFVGDLLRGLETDTALDMAELQETLGLRLTPLDESLAALADGPAA